MKICKKCSLSKTLDNYTFSKSTRDNLRNWCKDCFAKYDKERRAKLTPEYLAGRALVRYWPELSPLEANSKFIELSKSQSDLCSICNKSNTEGRRLCVDHCHKTGKVRALLCDNCNIGLGKFYDDTELMMKAIKYLERNSDESIQDD